MAEAKVKQVYDSEGFLEGRNLFILAPGPTLKLFPLKKLTDNFCFTIGVNSLIEFYSPTWWMFTDKRITRYYMHHLKKNPQQWIAVIKRNVSGIRKRYHGTIFEFEYQHKVKKRVKGRDPWWWWKEHNFLPGRTSVICNAMSFAQILRPKKVILVGVDFRIVEGQYYAGEVKYNPGPQNKEKALKSGLHWFKGGLEKLWNLNVVTTSKYLNRSTKIKLVSVEEALEW